MNTVLASIGVSISAIYAYFIWILVGSRIALLETMDLNNLGDFLAGVFGPITILWLVLGFFQQGYELRQNNKALKLQADELEKSVAQQTEMARLQALALANQSRLVQPLFEIKHIEEYFQEGDRFDRFELINSGGYCDCVNIRLFVNGVEEFQYELEPLSNGTRRPLSLADFGRVYEIHVSYRSIDDVLGTRIFDLENWFDDDGRKYPTLRQRPNKFEAEKSQN